MSTRTIADMVVETEGDGPAVIMIHGLGGTSNTFTPLLDVFSDRYRVIRPDLKGSGRSDFRGDLSMNGFMEDVLRLADALSIDEAHLVGHSMGTIICQHLAARHGDRVKSLVLLGALTEPPDAARGPIRERAAQARAEGMAGIADAVCQASLSTATKADLPVALAAVRESLMRQSPGGYAATCEALSEANAADAGRIAQPTLLITGEDDPVAPPTMARDLADRIQSCRLAVLPRCGHWPSFERAADVNREMRHFYARLAASRPAI